MDAGGITRRVKPKRTAKLGAPMPRRWDQAREMIASDGGYQLVHQGERGEPVNTIAQGGAVLSERSSA